MTKQLHIIKNISSLQEELLKSGSVFAIIDNNLQYLAEYFKGFPTLFIDTCEQTKTLQSIEKIAEWLLEAGADRNALVVGAGGGITTDITGFVASIYKRGVKFAFVPTTLLAQTDASIGGKNGVNFLSYKNILGTITQPEKIYICTDLLKTLPEDEFKAGIAEILKTFILFDKEYYRKAADYFALVQKRYNSYRNSRENIPPYGTVAANVDMDMLTCIIEKCAGYKCGVVERDQFERGERRMLNLGHTFAHSIEKLAEGTVPHGYAVSIGMVIAAQFAVAMGYGSTAFVEMLKTDLANAGLPVCLEDMAVTAKLKTSDLVDAVKKDKKVLGSNIHFIMPKGLEDVEDITIPLTKVKEIADGLC